MGTSRFRAGTQLKIDGKTAILLRKLDGDLWQVEDELSRRITEYKLTTLYGLYESGNLVFVDTLPPLSRKIKDNSSPENVGSDPALEIAKVRRLYVIAVIGLPNSRRVMESAIKALWVSIEEPDAAPSYISVYRWKRRYLEAGKDLRSLISRDGMKGNTRDRYPSEVTTFVDAAINTVYLTLERNTIQDTLDEATNCVKQENNLRPKSLQLPLPTRRLVQRMVSEIPAFDRYAARHGRDAAEKMFRAVLNQCTTSAPLERAQIDHTPLNLVVIDDETMLPLGRPFATACIDDFTRCVLGLYISFEPPSYFTVSRCLKQAFTPKTELLTLYPEIRHSWEAYGVPIELLVDNGQEFHSISLENASLSVGMEITYQPRRKAWLKGKIERFLKTFNEGVAQGVPGTTFSNILEKEDYDPSKFAIVRYSTLKKIAYLWIVDEYHQKPHRSLGVPPAVMWSSSIRDEDIPLPDNPARLDFLLGQSETRTLSHKGIELNGLFYNSPDLVALRRRHGAKFTVEIRWDKSDLGHITVISPTNSESFKVRCLQYKYANGLSFYQHRICKRFAASKWETFDPHAWLEAKSRIRQIVEDELMFKKTRSRAKVARYKNMDASPTPPEDDSKSGLPSAPTAPSIPPSEQKDVSTPVEPTPLPATSPASPKRRIAPVYRERRPNSDH
jgi:putative transposase